MLAVFSKLLLYGVILNDGLRMVPHQGEPGFSLAPVLELKGGVQKVAPPSAGLHLELLAHPFSEEISGW